jgi:predicted secreted protein
MEVVMIRILFLLIVTSLLTGCADSSFTPTPTLPPTAETPNTLPEPTDPTQLITVKAGETFDLVVPSNSSTGYRWNIIPELDENTVQFVEQNYMAEQPILPGSGGVDVWTFRAVNAGDTTVVLGYYPPGNDTNPEEHVTFSIHVE